MRLGVVTGDLEREAKEAEQREFEKALRRAEEGGGRSEVQWLAAELHIKALNSIDSERLEIEMCQEVDQWKDAELQQES